MSLKTENTNLQERVAFLEQQLASERAARAKAEQSASESLAHLNGFASFIGPCVHGRDPWTRCEECSQGNAVTAVLALFRQAERERDEARIDRTDYSVRLTDAVKALERAEADNAGLVGEVVRASAELRHAYRCKQDWNLVARAIEILERAPNPGGGRGAALLERLRALEEVREALQPFHEMAGALVCMRIDAPDDAPVRRTPINADHAHVVTMGHCRALVDAIAKADALRGKA